MTTRRSFITGLLATAAAPACPAQSASVFDPAWVADYAALGRADYLRRMGEALRALHDSQHMWSYPGGLRVAS